MLKVNTMLDTYLTAFLSSLPVVIAVLVALLVERVRPVEKHSPNSVPFNMSYTMFYTFAQETLKPILGFVAVSISGAAHWGLITLPSSGWFFIPAMLAYLFVMDFAEYLFHRFQHSVPFLWEMHSLHHSDTTLNASSVQRHFWLEYSLKTLTVFLLPALLFKVNHAFVLTYSVFSLYNVFSHMNLRLGFGKWSFLMNSPQYHRLHHSSLPEHYNCNFAGLFPIFDIIFGSYCQPMQDEYPPTGIEGGDTPVGLIEAILWPWRRMLRRAKRSLATLPD